MTQKSGSTDAKADKDDAPIQVDKWDGSAVKNALDDATKKIFLKKFGYEENHRLMDGRLAISTLGVCVAMFAVAWDYLYPFPQSQPVLVVCVVSYFILMGILTLYTTYKEKGIFLVALEKDPSGLDPDSVWEVSSQLKRFDHMYHLTVKVTTPSGHHESKLSKSVASWYDENGVLVFDTFEPDLCKLHNTILSKKKKKTN